MARLSTEQKAALLYAACRRHQPAHPQRPEGHRPSVTSSTLHGMQKVGPSPLLAVEDETATSQDC
jgi:hypothetical protein